MVNFKPYLILVCTTCFLALIIPNRYQEVETKNLLSGSSPISQVYEAPNSSSPFCIQNPNPGTPTLINLSYASDVSFDKVSMYFPGNAVNYTSFAPTFFKIAYQTPYGVEILSDIQNSSPYYEQTFPKKVTAKDFQLIMTPFSKDTGVICISDLKFYEVQNSNILEKISSFISLNHRKLGFYLAYYIVFLAFLFLPGYVILNFSKLKKMDNGLKILTGPIISMLILMIITILHFFVGRGIVLYLYLIIFLASIYLFMREKLYSEFFKSKEIFYVIAASIFIVFFVIIKRDYMFNLQYLGTFLDNQNPIPMEGYIGYFVDNFFPWGIARLYLNKSPIGSTQAKSFLLGTTLFERTPGLPLILTPILKIFGQSHQVYQRFLETLVGIYFGSIYFLAKKLFSKKTAVISILLILLNVQLLYIDFNAELFYKYIATYPALVALFFFNSDTKNKDTIVGSLLGLSFLIHPSTLVFSVAFGLAYILRYKISKNFIRKALPMVLIVGSLFLMWFLAPKIIKLDEFTNRNTSSYFNEAFSTEGSLLKAKVGNFIALFYPNPHLKDGNTTFEILSKNHKVQILRYSIIFNITPILFFALLYFAFKNFKKDYLLLSFIFSPLIVYWLIYLNKIDQYYNYGASYFLLYPFVVPISLMYVVEKILRIKNVLLGKGIIASYIFFMSINLYIISGIFRKDLVFPSPLPHLLTFCVTLVFLGLSGTLIYALDKND